MLVGWKAKPLLYAGKQALIKLALQYIPAHFRAAAYTMQGALENIKKNMWNFDASRTKDGTNRAIWAPIGIPLIKNYVEWVDLTF